MAEILGKEAALFLATGTLCNNVALAAHTRRGDAVLAERGSHVIRFEAAAAAMHSGLLIDQLTGERGTFSAAQVEAAFSAGSLHYPPTRVVCLEQTHNLAGGTIWDLDRWQDVCATTHRLGARVHVDGARLFNAVVASGVPAADAGPRAPIRSGSTSARASARRWARSWPAPPRSSTRPGGSSTSSAPACGSPASSPRRCLYALDHHIERLADDHAAAARLAGASRRWASGPTPTRRPTSSTSTRPRPGSPPAALCAGLAEHGVTMTPIGDRVRAVTHLDVPDDGIDRALAAAAAVVRRGPL